MILFTLNSWIVYRFDSVKKVSNWIIIQMCLIVVLHVQCEYVCVLLLKCRSFQSANIVHMLDVYTCAFIAWNQYMSTVDDIGVVVKLTHPYLHFFFPPSCSAYCHSFCTFFLISFYSHSIALLYAIHITMKSHTLIIRWSTRTHTPLR